MRRLIASILGIGANAIENSIVQHAATTYSAGRLYYGWRAKLLYGAVAALFLTLGGYILASPSNDPLAVELAMAAVGAGLAIWAILEAFFVRGRITPTHLEWYTPWRGQRHIPWDAFLGYRRHAGAHLYSTRGFGRVRMYTSLTGADDVVGYLMRSGRRLHPSWPDLTLVRRK